MSGIGEALLYVVLVGVALVAFVLALAYEDPSGFVVALAYEYPSFVLAPEAGCPDGLAPAIFVPAVAAEAGNGAGDSVAARQSHVSPVAGSD